MSICTSFLSSSHQANVISEIKSSTDLPFKQIRSHAQIYTDEAIAELLLISQSTIHRTRRYFVEYGLSDAIHDDPRSGQPRKLDGNQEALLWTLDRCVQSPINLKRRFIIKNLIWCQRIHRFKVLMVLV